MPRPRRSNIGRRTRHTNRVAVYRRSETDEEHSQRNRLNRASTSRRREEQSQEEREENRTENRLRQRRDLEVRTRLHRQDEQMHNN